MNEIYLKLLENTDAANAIAAIGAVFISVVSLLLALWSIAQQRRHNSLSFRPLASISRADYENLISVKIFNNGVGPLLIENLSVTDGQVTKQTVIEWMPSLPASVFWSTFTSDTTDRSLAPGDSIILLSLTGSVEDTNFCTAREQVREALAKLKLRLTYQDIYMKTMPVAERDLSWFGRKK